MALLEIKNVKITGISACVPKIVQENDTLSLFNSEEEAQKFIDTTGVERRHIVNKDTTTVDLCYHAANQLITELNWNREEIDCLVLVTQTPDYIVPASACILQNKLGLSEECFAFDVNLGCSGWVAGLNIISNLLSSGGMKKGLLLAGDTSSKRASIYDKSTWPLFGDATTATAIEFEENVSGFKFHLATDGSGSNNIRIPDGGHRNQVSESSFIYETFEEGIKRNRLQTVLEGMDVFMFGISKAPQSVNKLIDFFKINKEDVDFFVFHQANLFMNEKIRKKLKLPEEKVLYSLKNFGNTSSASIPLTLITEQADALKNKSQHIVACGFGVGLSWGTVSFNIEKIVCPALIEL